MRWLVIISLLLGGFSTAFAAVDFNRDVRPLLADRCYKCHGPDAKTREAKLRLDAGDQLRTEQKEILARITTHDVDDRMPPPKSGLDLSDAERQLIVQWIKEGGQVDGHWAFVAPRKPLIPAGVHPIDHLVRKELNGRGLKPSPFADKATRLRRVSFDITGLGPTAGEIARFEDGQESWPQVVRRLLASERYGERMAVDWLDVSRWADTSGLQYDIPRSTWLFRDWVINAFNRNLPYDQFITWQLAGDLLPNATTNQLIATGFNRIHPTTSEDGTIAEEYRVHYVADRTITMGTAFMGLTLECARCHDHKFDPISQKEFYGLFAFFNQMGEDGQAMGEVNYTPPGLPIPTTAERAHIAKLYQEYVELNQQLGQPDRALADGQRRWEKTIRSIWKPQSPKQVGAQSRVRLIQNTDLSVIFSGQPPRSDIYGVDLIPQDKNLTALRLEALRDPRLPNGGPGLARNGNAILTGIRVRVLTEDSEPQDVKIKRATASYSQQGFPVANVIDGENQSGWAFDAPQPTDHAAVFEFEKPITIAANQVLNVTMYFLGPYPGHSIGRFRLSTTTTANPCDADPSGFLHQFARKPEYARLQHERAELSTRYRVTQVPKYRGMFDRIQAIMKEQEDVSRKIAVAMIMQDNRPRPTHVLERGQYDKPREQVQIGTPAFLPPMRGLPPNRLGLARWLTSREHPLTSRVVANRLWQQFFGAGLVATANDFGVQGERPTHPELLDWLAVSLRENNWDLKWLIEQIVTSETYQQSSRAAKDLRERDPDNRLLARGPLRRMNAEMIRDHALHTGGLLVEKIGGPSAKPYQPAGLWKQLTNREKYQQIYAADKGDGLYRRSVYTFWKRAAHHPAMAAFDAPTREVCTVSREKTTTPQQAFVLLHDPQFVEAARALAERMFSESAFGKTPAERIRHAFQLATTRVPNDREVKLLEKLLAAEINRLTTAESTALLTVGESPVRAPAQRDELAAYTMVARTILNLSETITLD